MTEGDKCVPRGRYAGVHSRLNRSKFVAARPVSLCAFRSSIAPQSFCAALSCPSGKPIRRAATASEGGQSLVECTGLENRRARCGTGGSNPSPSASGRATSDGGPCGVLRAGAPLPRASGRIWFPASTSPPAAGSRWLPDGPVAARSGHRPNDLRLLSLRL